MELRSSALRAHNGEKISRQEAPQKSSEVTPLGETLRRKPKEAAPDRGPSNGRRIFREIRAGGGGVGL